MYLSVVLPIHNEEEVIEEVLSAVLAYLPSVCREFEILMINDGSTDRSSEVIDRLAQADARLRALHTASNRGYGWSIRRGFEESAGEHVFYMDSDGQFNIRDLGKLLDTMKETGADLVCGRRAERQDTWARRGSAAVFNLLVRGVFDISFEDVDCAFKLFRRSFFDKVALRSADFLIDTEIYVKAKRAGLKVVQCDVSHYPRLKGKSSIGPSAVPNTLLSLFRLRGDLRRHGANGHGAGPAADTLDQSSAS